MTFVCDLAQVVDAALIFSRSAEFSLAKPATKQTDKLGRGHTQRVVSPSTWGGRVQRYGPGARPHTTRGEASGSPLGLQRFSRRQHVPTNTHCAAIVSARGRAQSSWDVTKFCPFDLPLRALPISDFPFQNSPCTRGAGSRARSPPPWPP